MVRNEAAETNDLDFTVGGFLRKCWINTVEALAFPFVVDFAQHFGNEELQRGEDFLKRLGIANRGLNRQGRQDPMKMGADDFFGFGCLAQSIA